MSVVVVDTSRMESGVACVAMQDRINKNTFSPELIQGLTEAFEALGRDARCRVIVLTGYDSYFASGGTLADLLELHENDVSFTEARFYLLAFDCPLPVVAAMQGHGIGGGLILGLFADIVVLSRESVYTANFMKYGFTPGMGATCILPEKLGLQLAQEMLLTAAPLRGADLARRGAPFPVLPRQDVLPHALALATEVADKPRAALIALKAHLTSGIRAKLGGLIESEAVMQRQTIHAAEVKERILDRFGR